MTAAPGLTAALRMTVDPRTAPSVRQQNTRLSACPLSLRAATKFALLFLYKSQRGMKNSKNSPTENNAQKRRALPPQHLRTSAAPNRQLPICSLGHRFNSTETNSHPMKKHDNPSPHRPTAASTPWRGSDLRVSWQYERCLPQKRASASQAVAGTPRENASRAENEVPSGP
jgi:hypothetical protein